MNVVLGIWVIVGTARKVPARRMDGHQGQKPGEWITITSKQRPTSDADTIVAIRPYVQTDRS